MKRIKLFTATSRRERLYDMILTLNMNNRRLKNDDDDDDDDDDDNDYDDNN